MGKSLVEIAQELRDSAKKVQLIYAFNGVGKTRLSRAFKEMIAPKQDDNIAEDEQEETGAKIIYYNAFTEDLFYWDNDLDGDVNRKLNIRPNGFTRWILEDEGQANNIITLFQRYTSEKLTPKFNETYNEISFSIEGGNEERTENIKISRGEESCFIWCVFYSLLKEVIEVLSIAESENRSTSQFNDLEYIFIDDPVSSLDENHLIELAVNVAELIKSSPKELKFILTTHNPLFYNVIYNELGLKAKNKENSPCAYMLDKNEDGTFDITSKFGDSNKSFSYHLFLKQTIEEAVKSGNIQKYHFILLRNLYEKTANFLGYPQWSDLLPDDKQTYYNRIIQFTSHSTLSNETVAEPTSAEKQIVKYLLNHLIENRYWKEEKQQ
ncbi:anticodon nuclease prrc [Bacteroides heparinolyticus]|uniref:Anticodon nuclease prrc n=1 Tax=Prevotella heparinolytica TaxID=28113 RepID=A0A449I2J4_9BACE|nr:AAA family ATPase [Bacteroides heparinolyticus]VFB13614.1 anticodon nuclease prrc [Bacteroides heparinolyticus]